MKVQFSVLISVYNGADDIHHTIDSVLAQTFTDYEVIVVDDGSTDRTLQVLESYGTRIKVIQQSRRGPEAARNDAAVQACGHYLAMLDSGDRLLPSAFATYDRIIRTFDSPALLLGSIKTFRDGQPIPTNSTGSNKVEVLRFPDYMSKDLPVFHANSQFVIRKTLFEEMGGYGHNGVAAFPRDDFDFLLKAGTFGPCVIVLQPCTVAYHDKQNSSPAYINWAVDGLLGLVRFEKQGFYPGGRKRRWDRYAVLGGLAANSAVRHCWMRGHRKVAVRLFLGPPQWCLLHC